MLLIFFYCTGKNFPILHIILFSFKKNVNFFILVSKELFAVQLTNKKTIAMVTLWAIHFLYGKNDQTKGERYEKL